MRQRPDWPVFFGVVCERFPKVCPVQDAGTVVSRLAILQLSIPDNERLLPVAAGLDSIKGLVSWQAVDGNANIVALISGSADPLLDHLHKTAGEISMTMCETLPEQNNGAGPSFTSDCCYAWVFADIEESLRAGIQKQLSTIPQITNSWAARGGCDLVALVSGKTLDEVDRIISQQIQPLDGVLRLKRNRIINLNSL